VPGRRGDDKKLFYTLDKSELKPREIRTGESPRCWNDGERKGEGTRRREMVAQLRTMISGRDYPIKDEWK